MRRLNRFAGIQFDPVLWKRSRDYGAGLLDELYRDHWEPQEYRAGKPPESSGANVLYLTQEEPKAA